MSVSSHLEVKCSKYGKLFNSEAEMLKHYDNECTEVRKRRHFSRKKALAVGIIAILALSIFVYLGYLNGERVSKASDIDGDGIVNWDEVNLFHTDPNKIDTSGLGLDDFNAVYTYNIDPNNQSAVEAFLNKLPNVTANLWDPIKVGGFSTKNYVNKSLADPLIQYLALRSEIEWKDSARSEGALLVDGSPIWNGVDTHVDKAVQPSYYFTHGRNGDCVESTIAGMTVMKSMGYKAIEVGGMGHDWFEVIVGGKVYVQTYNSLYLRENFYRVGWVPDSNYDPDWYLK
jgi:hypothetical protein